MFLAQRQVDPLPVYTGRTCHMENFLPCVKYIPDTRTPDNNPHDQTLLFSPQFLDLGVMVTL